MRKPRVGQIFSLRSLGRYQTRPPMILVNGLAEQSESWCTNRPVWSKHFDVKVPELLVYDGPCREVRRSDVNRSMQEAGRIVTLSLRNPR